MRTSLKKFCVAAGAVAVITIGSAAPASARWHGHWHGGGFGPGFVGGLALGAAVASPYYYGGYYGAPYAYGAYYGPGCYVTRRPVINRWGHRVWRRVRVCD